MNETVVIRNFFPNTIFKNFGFKGWNAARSLIVKFVVLCQSAHPDIEMTYGEKEFKDQIAALKSEIEEPVDIKNIYKEFDGKSIRVNEKIKVSKIIFRVYNVLNWNNSDKEKIQSIFFLREKLIEFK